MVISQYQGNVAITSVLLHEYETQRQCWTAKAALRGLTLTASALREFALGEICGGVKGTCDRNDGSGRNLVIMRTTLEARPHRVEVLEYRDAGEFRSRSGGCSLETASTPGCSVTKQTAVSVRPSRAEAEERVSPQQQ